MGCLCFVCASDNRHCPPSASGNLKKASVLGIRKTLENLFNYFEPSELVFWVLSGAIDTLKYFKAKGIGVTVPFVPKWFTRNVITLSVGLAVNVSDSSYTT